MSNVVKKFKTALKIIGLSIITIYRKAEYFVGVNTQILRKFQKNEKNDQELTYNDG